MNLTKDKLSLWAIIAGFIWIPLFILAVAIYSPTIHVIFWIVAAVAWVGSVVLGILIIVDWVQRKGDDILYLIGGIFMLIFPVVGAIILLIDRLSKK